MYFCSRNNNNCNNNNVIVIFHSIQTFTCAIDSSYLYLFFTFNNKTSLLPGWESIDIKFNGSSEEIADISAESGEL